MAPLRNSLRPVNQLPPEILTSCATFVSDTDPRPIISLTHVCRYWRTSIISSPRNWTSIALGWKRLIPLCLERARAVPLAVDITVSDTKSGEDFLKPLLSQTSRIGCIRLTEYSFIEAVADDLPGFFDSPMPNLTSLELQQTTEPTELFPSSESPVPPVFQNVSKLKSLRLTRTPLYPTLLAIASLRELTLTGYTSLFHFGMFIQFLRSNPGLELIVSDIQFIEGSVETTLATKVPLPHLQHLSITCSKAIDSKGLLSSVSLPRGAHIEVTSTQTDLPAKLGPFLPSPPTPIRRLLAPITTIKAQVIPWELHLLGNGSAFTFRSPSSRSSSNALPGSGLFSTTKVRELYTNVHPYEYTDVGILKMLKRLPALETLAFSHTPFPPGLLLALVEEPVLCPALTTIAFFNCEMDSGLINALGEVIAERKSLAADRLDRVVIINSTGELPKRKVIRQLQKYVPCVEIGVSDKLPDLS